MIPKSITLNKNKKGIQLEYEDSMFLLLNSAYLRAYSPSAENKDKLSESDVSKRKEVYCTIISCFFPTFCNWTLTIITIDIEITLQSRRICSKRSCTISNDTTW